MPAIKRNPLPGESQFHKLFNDSLDQSQDDTVVMLLKEILGELRAIRQAERMRHWLPTRAEMAVLEKADAPE